MKREERREKKKKRGRTYYLYWYIQNPWKKYEIASMEVVRHHEDEHMDMGVVNVEVC